MWHNRLGHLHHQVLSRILKSYSISESGHSLLLSLCGAYQMGKSYRFPLPIIVSSSSRVLVLVYTDIWGLAFVLSSNG